MSMDIITYLPKFDNSIIPKWIDELNKFDMICDMHPNVNLSEHTGFLPFKIKMKETNIDLLKDKEFISGFEVYQSAFNYDERIKEIQNDEFNPREFYSNSNFKDECLKKCKHEVFFSFGSYNSFEYRTAMLSSAVLVKILDGMSLEPMNNIWLNREQVVEETIKKIKQYEDSLTELRVHEFKGWS